MKTLIIAGTYKPISVPLPNNGGTRYETHYNVTLFGQSKNQPLMVCIGFIDQQMNGFEELQRVARAKYCEYFNETLSDIISMEVLNERHRIIK